MRRTGSLSCKNFPFRQADPVRTGLASFLCASGPRKNVVYLQDFCLTCNQCLAHLYVCGVRAGPRGSICLDATVLR